jgi:hypothetical protein
MSFLLEINVLILSYLILIAASGLVRSQVNHFRLVIGWNAASGLVSIVQVNHFRLVVDEMIHPDWSGVR